MVVDPNELLIFKLRGMTTAPQNIAKQQIQKQPTNVQSVQNTNLAQPKQEMVAKQQAPQVKPSLVQNKAKQSAESKQSPFNKENIISIENIPSTPESEEENMPIFTPNYISQTQEVKPREGGKKYNKLEKESMEAAKNMFCVNHPWRPAYAICNYCKRPFCYADLVEYQGAFYCLEDIDKVSGSAQSLTQIKFNSFIALSSFFLIANALIMGYFVYPQAKFLVNYISSVGFSGFLDNLTYSYGLSFINLLVVLFSALAGLILFAKSDRWFYLSWVIDSFVLIISSYEYLTLNSSYLLAISVLSLITIGTLSYSRLSRSTEEIAKAGEAINWPRIETFD